MSQAAVSAYRVLIIEDDADINDIVAAFLAKQGFCCTQAYSGSEARLVLAAQGGFDLIITDLMLPGLSGNQLVDLIRTTSQVPIIVTSAQDTPAEKLTLFELGVDDYLVKPFDLNELLARVTVQLRHASRLSESVSAGHGEDSSSAARSSRDMQEASPSHAARPSTTLTYKDWQLDPEARLFSVATTPVKLTRTEFNILEALVRRPSKVYTKQELFELAWQEEAYVEEKAINVHISNIRSKLKPSGTDGYIETVWGIGYKLA
ncbi:MAG TPA: DNA-binding response regulator [Coriobacteriia bacterium]|nr:DNA-binding response regulator [Coriobacteriia bacterium]